MRLPLGGPRTVLANRCCPQANRPVHFQCTSLISMLSTLLPFLQEHSEDAANYMIEVWRVLKTGGLFILVSTMPPQVLEALGIIPLAELRSGRSPVCDWNNGARVRPLTTTEGGQVYYYAIRKIAPCGKSTSHRLATAGAAPGSKEDIMAGIQALLAEARKAKEQMDSAEAQVT